MLSRWLQAARRLSPNETAAPGGGLVRVLAGGLAAAVSGMFLSRALGTLAQILIVRTLGPALYGEYTSIVVSLSLFASLLGLGLDTWLLQEGGRDPENVSHPMLQVLAVKASTAAALLIVLVVAWSNSVGQAPAFMIGAVGTIFESFAQTGYSALRVRRKNTLVAIFQTVTPLLVVVLLLAVSRTAVSVLLLMSIQASCSVLMAIVVLTRIWQQRRRGIERPRLTLWPAVRKGWLFVVSEGLSNIYTQANLAVLGATAGTLALGIFNPALNLIRLTYLVPNLLFSVGLPLLMAPNLALAEYRRVTRLMMLVCVMYGLGAMIAIWFFGQLLIVRIFGAEFTASLTYVRIMSLLPLLKACNFVWVAILLANLQQKLRVIVQGLVVLVCLAVGWLVIPSYGATGAAWVYLGIEGLLFVMYGLAAWAISRQRT